MSYETIPEKILKTGTRRASDDAYAVRHDDQWVPTSWSVYADQVRAAARSLIALGVQPGSAVSILGTNTPEWVVFDVAAMAIGSTPAGIYPTSSPEECTYVLNHSQSPVVLVQNEGQLEKILAVRDGIPSLNHIVLMPGASSDADGVMTWDEFIGAGADVETSAVDDRLATLGPQDGAVLIYT